MSMKNSNDIVGNRNGDIPACGAVPQPTAAPRAPMNSCIFHNLRRNYCSNHNQQLYNNICFSVTDSNVLPDDGECNSGTCRRNTIYVCNE